MDIGLALEDVFVVAGYFMAAITFLTFVLFALVRVLQRLGLMSDEEGTGRVSEFLRNFR